MTTEELCTVEVMLNGHAHQVVVAGNNAPAFGFEPIADEQHQRGHAAPISALA